MHPLTKLVLVLLVVALAGVTLYVANQRRHEGQSGGPESVSTPVEQAAEGRRSFQDPLATYERWRNRLGERQAAPTSESPRPPAIDLQSSSVNEGTVVAQRLETPVAGADPPGPTLKPAGVEGEVVTTPWTEPEAAAKDNTYVIAAGDTLYGIAMKRYGDPKFVSAIEAANPGIDARALRVGDRIVLPERQAERQAAESKPEAAAAAAAPKVYVVRRNDTLIGIARRFYGDAAAYRKIYEANRDVLSSANATLYVGMRLRLPEP